MKKLTFKVLFFIFRVHKVSIRKRIPYLVNDVDSIAVTMLFLRVCYFDSSAIQVKYSVGRHGMKFWHLVSQLGCAMILLGMHKRMVKANKG